MAAVSAADIKKLRAATGAGMTDCKKALVESDGDYDKAVEQLRIKGLKGVAKREDRAASNGLVIAKSEAAGKATLLELACETDFVAKSAPFQELANKVIEVAFGAADVAALQDVQVDGKPLTDVLNDANASMGEKIEVRRVATLEGARVGVYLHKTNPDLPPQLGVLVALTKDDETVGAVLRDAGVEVTGFVRYKVGQT